MRDEVHSNAKLLLNLKMLLIFNFSIFDFGRCSFTLLAMYFHSLVRAASGGVLR